jgi:hypothetical protein
VRGTGLAAALIALVCVGTGAAVGARPAAHLRLVDRAPLTVRGTHFRARELVRVTVVADGVTRRSVRSSRDGSFTVRFAALSVGRCGEVSAQAVGARGERASLKVLQPQDCAPGLGP